MNLYANRFVNALKAYDPATVVLVEGGRSITAGALLEASAALAAGCLLKGVQPGHRVVLAVQPGIEFLTVMYANMMAGTLISIIDPEMGRDNYLAKLEQFAPHHVFIDSRILLLEEHPLLRWLAHRLNRYLPTFPGVRQFSLFTTGPALPILRKHISVSSLGRKGISNPVFLPVDESASLLVTYTSGTVNAPKGVVHSVASLGRSIEHLTGLLRRNKDQAIATHLPHYALLGINAGIKVYLWNPKARPADKIRFILKHQITTLFGPPNDFVPLLHYLSKRSEMLPSCLRNIYLGSAPVYKSFLARLMPLAAQARVTCLYGMTENLMVTWQDGQEKLEDAEPADLVGRPFADVALQIAEDGEVCIRSDQLFTHYWQQEKAAGVHRTGDLGRIDDQGRLVLLGRKKDMIIRRNFNIYPGLYEPTISRIPGVQEAVMVGRYNKHTADEEVVLAVAAAPGATLKEAALMKQLSAGPFSIDREALPDRIFFMEIPHAGRQNKVDRKQLAERIKSMD